MSDYVFNTAGWAFYETGALKIAVTPNEVPANSPVHLNTQAFKSIVPALYKKYPNANMSLVIQATEAPKVKKPQQNKNNYRTQSKVFLFGLLFFFSLLLAYHLSLFVDLPPCHPFPFFSFPVLSFPFLSFPFLSFPFLSFPFLSFIILPNSCAPLLKSNLTLSSQTLVWPGPAINVSVVADITWNVIQANKTVPAFVTQLSLVVDTRVSQKTAPLGLIVVVVMLLLSYVVVLCCCLMLSYVVVLCCCCCLMLLSSVVVVVVSFLLFLLKCLLL